MKRFLSLLLVLLFSSHLYAQTLNSQQNAFRDDVYKFLKEKGYSPEKTKDGIVFKIDGINYYVTVDSTARKPMFITLQRRVKTGSGKLTKENILKKLNSYNNRFITKVYLKNNLLVLSTELFASKSSEFIYAIPTYLSEIKNTYNDIME